MTMTDRSDDGAGGQIPPALTQTPSAPAAEPWQIAERTVPPAIEYVRLCARVHLAPHQTERLRALAAQLDEAGWREVVETALSEGVYSLVFLHTSQTGALASMPAEAASTLGALFRRALVINGDLRRAQRAIVAALAARRIEVIALKGADLAERLYPQLALRPISDIDLLVHRRDLRRVSRMLAGLGFHPERGRHPWRTLASTLDGDVSYVRAGGMKLELHWELTHRPSYRAGLASRGAWRRSQALVQDASTLRRLSAADEVRFLCVHATADHRADRMDARLIWLVDIATLIDSLPGMWDWEVFTRETSVLGLATPVAIALAACRVYLGAAVPPATLQALGAAAASPSERRAWQAIRTDIFTPGGWRHYFAAAPNLAAKVALLRALALPDRWWIREHYERATIKGTVIPPIWQAYLRYYWRVIRRAWPLTRMRQ